MKVIAYWIGGLKYQVLASKLQDSLDKYKINYKIEHLFEKGSKIANCAQKPSYILKSLIDIKKPIFYTDIDSIFVRKPNMFYNNSLEQFDIAISYNEKTKEIISGSMFLNYSNKTIDFLSEWVINQSKDINNQIVLQQTLKIWEGEINVLTLPLEYCNIYNNKIKNPVIIYSK